MYTSCSDRRRRGAGSAYELLVCAKLQWLYRFPALLVVMLVLVGLASAAHAQEALDPADLVLPIDAVGPGWMMTSQVSATTSAIIDTRGVTYRQSAIGWEVAVSVGVSPDVETAALVLAQFDAQFSSTLESWEAVHLQHALAYVGRRRLQVTGSLTLVDTLYVFRIERAVAYLFVRTLASDATEAALLARQLALLQEQRLLDALQGPQAMPTTHCPPGQSPRFVFGFAALKEYLGERMGAPVTCEFAAPTGTGDVHQLTSTGLAVWRARTNTPLFTTGVEYWAYTPNGREHWLRTRGDPPPEWVPPDLLDEA